MEESRLEPTRKLIPAAGIFVAALRVLPPFAPPSTYLLNQSQMRLLFVL